MSPKDMADYIRFRTKTSSATFTDTQIKLLLGIYIDEFAKEIIKVNEDYFGMPQTTDLVANQREYPLPVDNLNQIKFVEAKLDGTTWIPLNALDLNTYKRATDESTIISLFSNEKDKAAYDIFRGSLWLYSGTISNVTDGLKLWSFSWPAHITDLSSETDISADPNTTGHGFPRAFHKLLCDRVVIEYKEAGEKPIPLNEREQNFQIFFRQALISISDMDLSDSITPVLPPASDRGNDGADY
jgi:hypothetical protein